MTEKEAFEVGHMQGLNDSAAQRDKNPFRNTKYGQPVNYPAMHDWANGFDRALRDFAHGHRGPV